MGRHSRAGRARTTSLRPRALLPATYGCAWRVLPSGQCAPSTELGPRRGGSNELEDETDEGERLGERDAEEHRRPHVAGHLGLAGHRLHRLADQVTDTDAGADGGEAVTDRTEAGLEGVRLRHRQAHELVHLLLLGCWCWMVGA